MADHNVRRLIDDGWRFSTQCNEHDRFIAISRGSERHVRRISAGQLMDVRDYNGVLELCRDELAKLAFLATRKNGVVVGVAGKWRKWGRAA